jgi:hypothetical protein
MSEPIRFEQDTVYRTFSGVRYRCTYRTAMYATFAADGSTDEERKQIHVVQDAGAGRTVETASPFGKMIKASDRADQPAKRVERKRRAIKFRDGTAYENDRGGWRKVVIAPDGRTIRGAHKAQPATKKDRRRARRGEPYRSRSGAMLQVVDGQIREV